MAGVVAALATIPAIAAIELELPPDLQGELVAEGRIIRCDFRGERTGRRTTGGKVLVGVTIDTADRPYLRVQGRRWERDKFEAICTYRPTVRVTYHAVKRVFGTVHFWIDDMAAIGR